MKRVIDIPEETFRYYVTLANKGGEQIGNLERIILDSTPLPKHHGRLIDYECVVDAIDNWINAREYSYTNATYYLRERVEDIPTIIEGSNTE